MSSETTRVVRHKKRGTTYEVIGTAELQMATDLGDGAFLTVYRGEDGKWWARQEDEFEDGRFEDVSKPKSGTTEVTWDDPRVVALARSRCITADNQPCDGPGNDCDGDNCYTVARAMKEVPHAD